MEHTILPFNTTSSSSPTEQTDFNSTAGNTWSGAIKMAIILKT
jgi:hypothetical protein